MAIQLNPYINFQGQTRAAMEFYKTVFDGELTMQTFKDLNASDDPEDADKIMHAQLIADSLVLMAADVPNRMPFERGENNFSISLSGNDEIKLRNYFERLSANGNVTMPLSRASWGDTFGMVIDQFGISWLINISTPKNAS